MDRTRQAVNAEIEREQEAWNVTLADARQRVRAWDADAEEIVERHRLELEEVIGGLDNARANLRAYEQRAKRAHERWHAMLHAVEIGRPGS